MNSYVVVYDQSTAKAQSFEYTDRATAFQHFLDLGTKNRGNKNIEVNIVHAESMAALRKGWKRWFH